MISGLFVAPVWAVEVITHSSVSQHTLTTSQLRRIYTMRQLQWLDGNAITVFVLPSQHQLHKHFSKEQLQIFPYQLNRIWHKLTYSGLGVAPVIVNSPQALIEAVIRTPGSIGYADKDLLAELMRKLNNNSKNNKEKNSSKGVVHVVTIKS